MSLARISLPLSHHASLLFIDSGRSSGLYPVSSQSYCMYVRAGLPAFAWPCEGVHSRRSLMSSSPLLQQCPTCLVRLTSIVFAMRGRCPYSCCFVGCCLQDVFQIARSILVLLPSSFFSIRFVSVHLVHPYSSIDTTAAWKKVRFIVWRFYGVGWGGTERAKPSTRILAGCAAHFYKLQTFMKLLFW